MSKYTPGPWRAHQESKMDTVLYANNDKNIIAVADGFMECDLENFTLMAAAPEILEALKAQHNAIDILFAMLIERDDNFFPSKSGVVWDSVIKANELIARTEKE